MGEREREGVRGHITRPRGLIIVIIIIIHGRNISSCVSSIISRNNISISRLNYDSDICSNNSSINCYNNNSISSRSNRSIISNSNPISSSRYSSNNNSIS